MEKHKPSRHDTLHFINYASEVAELGADGSSFTGSRKLTKTALALQSIAAQTDEKRPSRVLLFTDGYSTEPLQEAAAQMQARGIPLDFRLIREETENDSRIARIGFPERVQVGEPFLISITVRGATDATFPLILRRNGQTLTESPVTLVNGQATVEFTDRIPRGGGFEYQAEIRPETDAHPGNNHATRWIEITGGPRIVLATRYQDDPVAKALAALDFTVETVSDPSQLKPGLLAGARAVIFNNVPAHEIPADFMKSLDFFVREQGGGFLMAGGQQSFGSGGFFQSPIDPLLPVSMELKSEHRKLAVALAIVIDRSGSMSVGVGGGKTKIDLADYRRGQRHRTARPDGPDRRVRRGQRGDQDHPADPHRKQEGGTRRPGDEDPFFRRRHLRLRGTQGGVGRTEEIPRRNPPRHSVFRCAAIPRNPATTRT